MYMYISSTTTSLGDCYLKKQHDWCNTRILEQESVVSTKRTGSLPWLQYTGRISCGLRQSALIGTNPRFRRGVGGDGYHKVFHREERGYGIQDNVCRCLGWGEGEEEEGEEDYMPICEVEGEFQEVLNLLIENGRRRSRGGLYKCCSAGLGRGRSLKGGSFCAERRISARVCVDRPGDQLLLGSPCSHLRKTMFHVQLQDPYRSCYGAGIRCVGKGSEHLGCQCRWRKCVRESTPKATVDKQGSSRGDLLIEEERRYKTGLKGSLSDWRNRIRWISTLELENEEERVGKGAEGISLVKSLVQLRGNARWASGVGSCRREETVQKDNERTGLERSCTESRNGTWTSTVDSRNHKETFREGSKKFGSNTLSKGTCHSTVQFKETVDKATQTTDSKALLSNWRSNVRQSSTVVSNKQKLAQETIKKSSFKVPLNNVSNTTQVSIQEQQDRISLVCGENSGIGLRLEKDSSDQTVQNEGGPSVSCMPSGISIHTTDCNSSAKSDERERDENTTEKLFSQSQDELYSKENTKNRLEKNRGELVSVMTSADSRKMTLTKTTERLAFQKTDELFKGNVTRPSTALNKEKEENVKTAYERLSTPIASNISSQKLFTDSFSSESDTVFSSGSILEKKTSTLDYGKDNEASQKLFETSSYTPICNEISHSSRGKTQSTRIVERTNRTSENLFQTASSKRKEENIESFVDHETGGKMSSDASCDFSSKVTSNEMLGMATESKSRYIVETETDMTSGKSTQTRLSDVSNSSLGMVSAEGTENHGSTEKSSLDLHSPLLTSGDNPTKGPSEEVWAIGGWSSREEFDELRSSGKEKEEKDSTILASEEPLNKLQKNMDQHPISESEEGQVSTLKKNGKVIVKKPSRGIWGTFLEVCSKGWGLHEESETSAQRSGSGRPSTESTEGEGWFSVPELDNDECTTKEKAAKDKKKIPTKRQMNILISDTGENTGVHLNEPEKTQKEKGQSSDRKMAFEGSVDKLKLTRRRFSITTNKEHELQEQGKQERTDSIVDPKKAQVTQQEKMQKAAGNWSLERTSGYELPVSTGPVPCELYKEHGQMEKEKGKVDLVSKEEREEHEDTERLIQRSEIEEKKKMTKKMKRSKQVPKETFISWEEALVFESEQRQEDEEFMREALSEARMAADAWEVPVGAVLVHGGRIVARAHNLVEETRDATAHAEMLCIRYASNQLKTWRLAETTLYVTLEPCPMCAGAILQARIGTVVWGAPNKLLGADGSWVSLFPRGNEGALHSTSEGPPTAGPIHPFHPNIKIRRGVLASDCSDMMQQFFKLRRQKEKKTQSNSCFSLTNYPSKLFTKLHDIFSVFCL